MMNKRNAYSSHKRSGLGGVRGGQHGRPIYLLHVHCGGGGQWTRLRRRIANIGFHSEQVLLIFGGNLDQFAVSGYRGRAGQLRTINYIDLNIFFDQLVGRLLFGHRHWLFQAAAAFLLRRWLFA